MAHIFKIDMNVDTAGVTPALLLKEATPEAQESYKAKLVAWSKADPNTRGKAPELDREKMGEAEYFKSIVMSSISQAHKQGNTQVLRRTRAIADLLEIAIIDNGGILKATQEDYKFIKSSMAKADQWNNLENIAKSILVVEDAINDVEEIDTAKAG